MIITAEGAFFYIGEGSDRYYLCGKVMVFSSFSLGFIPLEWIESSVLKNYLYLVEEV